MVAAAYCALSDGLSKPSDGATKTGRSEELFYGKLLPEDSLHIVQYGGLTPTKSDEQLQNSS